MTSAPAPPSAAEGAQGHSESKDKKTPEKASLSHLVEKRSARGLCPGQAGVMGYVIWAILWPCALRGPAEDSWDPWEGEGG